MPREEKPARRPALLNAVIEVNDRCNLRCRACFKKNRGQTKPLSQVKAEVDAILSVRPVEFVTVLGGEPTLHPQLAEVVEYISKKGLGVQLFTNGCTLDARLLDKLRAAGLNKVFLHIDAAQQRPDAPDCQSEHDLNGLRQKLAQQVCDHGLRCCLATTVYPSSLDQVAEIVDFVLDCPLIEELYLFGCFDSAKTARRLLHGVDESDRGDAPRVTTQAIRAVLQSRHGLRPHAYLASSHRDDEERWLFYQLFCLNYDDRPPRYYQFSPRLDGAMQSFLRFGAQSPRFLKSFFDPEIPFLGTFTTGQSALFMFAFGIGGVAPGAIAFLRHLLKKPSVRRRVEICFQQGPNVLPDGSLEHCDHCPDATYRDGHLVPVCLADHVEPAILASHVTCC